MGTKTYEYDVIKTSSLETDIYEDKNCIWIFLRIIDRENKHDYGNE